MVAPHRCASLPGDKKGGSYAFEARHVAAHWRWPRRCGSLLAAPALAQAPWPNKTVRFVVPFPPGQAADIFARLMAEKLTDVWKQQVIVENKAGGSGIPATEYGKARRPTAIR